MSRLGLLHPSELDAAQRELYDELVRYTKSHYANKFVYLDAEERFVGPFGILLHSPELGVPFLNFANALRAFKLPPRVRECTILGVGSRTKAAYEEYAHQKVSGFPAADLSEMHEGRIPSGYNEQEKAAFELAMELGTPGLLPQASYERYQKVLGRSIIGVIHLAGFYSYVSTVLNAFDVQVPE